MRSILRRVAFRGATRRISQAKGDHDMKWVATLALGAIALLATSPPGYAGDYHSGLTLRCGECHIMHYSQSHGYQPSGGGFYQNPGAGGPFHYLLRDEINNLCLSCHDQGGFAPDVLGSTNGGNGPTDVRLAGYLNRLGVVGSAAAGHTLDSTDVAPGSQPNWSNPDGLNCIDCHHQHGRGDAYRNLTGSPGNLAYNVANLVTYNKATIGTNDLLLDVFERQAAEYDEADMDWNEPDVAGSKIATWCGGCHTDFHGAVGGSEVGGTASGAGFAEFVRHPSSTVNIGDVGGGHSRLSIYAGNTAKVKVMSASGDWTGGTADVTPTCISCHKSHGNANAFGLIYRKGSDPLTDITENGSLGGGQLENLCGQCHGQGSAFN
jgi:cytochrome c553